MTFHQFWRPLLLITLLKCIRRRTLFLLHSLDASRQGPSVGIYPFLLKVLIVVAAGPIFFLLLKVGLFR